MRVYYPDAPEGCMDSFKAISVKNLKTILTVIPDDYLITPNEIKNLVIMSPGELPDGRPYAEELIGYLDISEETFHAFKPGTTQEEL